MRKTSCFINELWLHKSPNRREIWILFPYSSWKRTFNHYMMNSGAVRTKLGGCLPLAHITEAQRGSELKKLNESGTGEIRFLMDYANYSSTYRRTLTEFLKSSLQAFRLSIGPHVQHSSNQYP
ncbi:hypothetical protein N42HA_00134 [Lactococcus lactis]|nr:hypothetical protein [Lactococcus lactis]